MIKGIIEIFSEEEKAKIHKFLANIAIAEENLENTKDVIEIFAKYGLSLSKATDLRIIIIDAETLEKRIEEYCKKDKYNIIKDNISLLRYKENIILSRIEDCERVGKGFLNPDGTLQNFILNADEWERVSAGINIDEINERVLPSHMTFDQAFDEEKTKFVEEALQQTEINLDIEEFEKYSNLVKIYDNAFVAAGIIVEDEYKERAEGIIMSLVAFEKEHKGSLSDIDIVYSAVIYAGFCTREDAESIKPIIEALINSENMDLEGSGVKR